MADVLFIKRVPNGGDSTKTDALQEAETGDTLGTAHGGSGRAGITADTFLYASATDTFSEAPLTAAGRALLDDADAAAQRTTLGVAIGTDVQAYDATLQSLSALGTVADRVAYTTALDTWAETALTSFGRSLIDDADAATARTTLGLGTMAVETAADYLTSANLLGTVGNLTTTLCSIDLQNGISGKWAGVLEFANATAVNRTYVDRYGVVQYAGTYEPRDGLLEGSSQNDALYARDLTNAAWVKTNGTAALDAIGKDAVAASASSFTATSANATVLQAITNASESRAYTADVKRKTGTGTVEMTIDGGTTWVDITSSLSTTEYTRFEVIQTVTNSQFGFRVVTSADAIEVDFNQNEASAFATSRIPTTTAAVTRQADTLNFPARGNFPNPDDGFTLFMDFTPLADGADYAAIRLFGSNDTAGTNYEWRTVAGAYALTTYTGGLQQAILAADIVAGVKARWAFSYKNVGSNVEWSVSKDGVVKGSGSVAGSITVPDDVFEVGYWSNDSTHTDGIYDNIRIMDHATATEVIIG